jgi:hypothetical protein
MSWAMLITARMSQRRLSPGLLAEVSDIKLTTFLLSCWRWLQLCQRWIQLMWAGVLARAHPALTR